MADLGDLSWHRVVGAAAVLVVAVGIAVILRLLTGRLFRRAGDTRWAWDDLAARLVKDLAVPVSVLLGLWGAARVLDLPRGTLDVTAKVLTAAAILIVSLAMARLIAGSVTSIALARQGVAANVTIFANITRVVVLCVGVLVMLQSLGISISPLLGALGVGGLAVALALQDTLANLFAGVHVLASKTIEPGDYIKLSSGQEGYVVDINWRNTSIRTLSDNIEVIPNQRFSDTILTNYHRPAEDMSLLIQARVAYESDLERVESVVVEVGQEVMNEVQGGVKDSETLVRFHTFGDSSIGFTVILRTDEFGDQFRLKHEFVKRLHRRFVKEGIEMPYPRRQLILPDGEGTHGLVSG
ncbi:mechanosensitive ion channel family protein [Actinomadura citrea]|jgi:small-conductance mechanosensitive channel|uniref:Small-conductance mechanosensitive channel n=1 Tax=Actinomadura citrea TaxID=46158 RepID=A0A7Y9KH17_9ACTN|nr:mechanosensitive ion channel family protein [Actinomadura citrea]NYE15279.1 small-conductance mechanosensitive channel [Actinomadura citrea]